MQTLLIRPTSPLGAYITQFWLWEQSNPLVIPDILPGTGVEIMFNLGAPLAIELPTQTQLKSGDGLVICPRKSVFKMKATGATKLLSVRFRSAGFFQLFGVPLTAIADQIVEASQIMPKELLLRIIESGSNIELISLLEGWLMQQIRPKSSGATELEWAIDQIYYQNCHDVIVNVKGSLKVSERTFQRKFKAYTGVDAKYFERTSRFQSTLRALLSGRSHQYTSVALDHGYYDQPYFIKEFKRFTGQTPKQFLTEENFMLNHYNNEIYD
ncbi:helix-turn-helix domain-containing protein [Photobacterium sp. SDRW27]|uniref:helix-turn-helix domain-containing protein n=1 Tax=Photobacterium obscurum TaxID=2829490 RepID=UPI002243FDE3|nr:helix-turn-helix domain-containing protein [Photobacterium obscurum]MCW8331022.1 helix-turn-helix domain-containing protein [Photobacterium obscurum]